MITFSNVVNAQFSLEKGYSNLEISGDIQSYFNYRFLKSGETDYKKNRFAVDYAEINFKGYISKYWKYEIEANVIGIPTNSLVEDNGFINEANVVYRGFGPYLDIEAGYSKLPFSRASMLSKLNSAFLQRPEMARGDVFSRRDVGVTAIVHALDQKVEASFGMYNGLGEGSLGNDNDSKGNFEYVSRVEFNYPSPLGNEALDRVNSPVPVFCIAGNARYADKAIVTGTEYGIKTIVGKKFSYGGDLALKYKGFQATFELLQFRMQPDDSTDILLQGKPTNYVLSGGYVAELNYYSQKYRTALAVRYDEYNPSDLIKGDTRKNLCFAINYFTRGNSTFRVQYWHRLNLDSTNEPWADEQIRLAWLLRI